MPELYLTKIILEIDQKVQAWITTLLFTLEKIEHMALGEFLPLFFLYFCSSFSSFVIFSCLPLFLSFFRNSLIIDAQATIKHFFFLIVEIKSVWHHTCHVFLCNMQKLLSSGLRNHRDTHVITQMIRLMLPRTCWVGG